jgi:flagellar hook-associated protein 1
LGQDLTGAMGGNYFDLSQMGPTVYANSNNTGFGSPAVTISSVGNLTTSDYQLAYDGAAYTLMRLSDNTVMFSGAALPQTVDGLTIAAGTWLPNANDSIMIQPTRAAAGNLALAITDPRSIAAAAPIRTNASLNNTGTGSISAGSVVGPPPTNANLQDSVTITFTPAGTFDVFDNTTATTLATGMPYSAGTGATVSYNGWTARLSGSPATNDTFTLGPNSNGVSDSRNAVLLAGLQTQSRVAGGSATYQAAYAQIVSTVGNTARQVEVTGQAQQSLAEQAQTARDQLSGVNLDEEAANLMRYQQAYQASAKIFDIAGKLFDQILALKS